jgi:tetratricopeptide (TPR) repeat protein
MNNVQTRKWASALLFALLCGCAVSTQAKHDKYLSRGKALLEKHEYSRAILEFRNAARIMPKDAEAYYQIGVAAEESGDIRTAVAFYKKALTENPKHAGAQFKMAQLMSLTLDKTMVQDSETQLKALKQSSPASLEVLETLAFAELRLGKTEDAIENLDQALATAPRELSSSILLARAKLAQGDSKNAEEVLKNACAAAPKSAEPHVALGDFYEIEKRTSDAQAEFQRALALDPQNEQALMDLALLRRSLGQIPEAEEDFKRLAKLGDARYRPVYAEFLFEEGRRAEAVREFERIAKENPNDRHARTQLVTAYQAVNRTADAQRVLEQALKENPKDLDALLQRSELSLASAKYAQAEGDLNEVLMLRPNSGEAHYILAKVYASRGETLSYREQLTEALKLNPYLEQIRVELAQSFLRDNQAQAALETLNAAPSAEKRSLAIIAERNWALWASGDMAQMRKGIDEGLSLRRSSDFLIQDGLWKLRAGNPTGARTSLQEALKLNPTDLRALSGLSQAYLAQKQTALALQTVEEYAAREPKSAPVQEFLGTMLLMHGDRQKARAAFMAAKSADSNFMDADFSLVQLDVLEGKDDAAQKTLQSILSRNAGNEVASLWMANLQVAEGKNDTAIQHFTQVLNDNPNNALALNNLAYLLTQSHKEPDEALKFAQKAIELEPDNPNFLDTLGWVLYEKGLYPSAIQYLERAVSDKGDAVSRYHLAMAYAKAGDLARGRTTLEAALKVNPKLPEAKTAEQLLGAAH